jgi:hypothetical protein
MFNDMTILISSQASSRLDINWTLVNWNTALNPKLRRDSLYHFLCLLNLMWIKFNIKRTRFNRY